ncbi:MAG: helix-turn-helix domain-containing protein [Ruminococcus sp.]|nr:helix-turn-helix domain-containing protein [Ruminococcus sp.]
MFSDNLILLRKAKNMTQEELAEKLNVTRQTLSKWETGDSLPDIEKCRMIAEIFDVSIDELVTHENINGKLLVPPMGKHLFGTVKVGDKGQIVIPAKARKIFNINVGDSLIVLGDDTHGIAILKEQDFMYMLGEIEKIIK